MEAPTQVLHLALQPTSPQGLGGLYSPPPHKPQLGVEDLSLLFGGVWVDVRELPALWGEGSPEAQFLPVLLKAPASAGLL